MIFNYTAEAEDGTEFGGTVEGELADDLRPVFAKARELAAERYAEVVVMEISWTS